MSSLQNELGHFVGVFQKRTDRVPRVPRVGDFEECPPAEAPFVVHGGNPERAGRRDFRGLVLLSLTGHFEDQVQQIVGAVAIVDARDEVGDVPLLVAVEVVRNEEAEVVVLHVADDFGQIVFQGLSELLLPRIRVADDMRNVTLRRVGRVGRVGRVDGSRRAEVDPALTIIDSTDLSEAHGIGFEIRVPFAQRVIGSWHDT